MADVENIEKRGVEGMMKSIRLVVAWKWMPSGHRRESTPRSLSVERVFIAEAVRHMGMGRGIKPRGRLSPYIFFVAFDYNQGEEKRPVS